MSLQGSDGQDKPQPGPALRRASFDVRRASLPASSSLWSLASQNTSATVQENEEDEIEIDFASFAASHNFTSVLNNPKENWLSEMMSDAMDKQAIQARPNLPLLDRADFNTYLNKVGPIYKKFVHNQRMAKELPSEDVDTISAEDQEKLDAIPKVYFEELFQLEDPGTFDLVTGDIKSAAESLMMQEKLSQYLDTVEVHLLKQVSKRSDSFFNALTTLQDVHKEVTSTCEQISELREYVRCIENDAVTEPLIVASIFKRRQRTQTLFQKLHLISTVRQTQPTIQLLLRSMDFSGALDLIGSTQRVLATELAGVQCLRNVNTQLMEMITLVDKIMCTEFVDISSAELHPDSIQTDTYFHSVQENLVPLILGLLRIGKFSDALAIYREKMSSAVKSFIKRCLKESLPNDEDDKGGDVDGENGGDGDGGVADKQGGAGAGQRAASPTPKDGADKDGKGGQSLPDRLRAMDPDVFTSVLEKIFAGILFILQRAADMHELMTNVIESIEMVADEEEKAILKGNTSDAVPDGDVADTDDQRRAGASVAGGVTVINNLSTVMTAELKDKLMKESAHLLATLMELAHARCAKLLGLRSAVTAKLKLPAFVRIFEKSLSFIVAGEKLGRKQCVVLRGSLLTQAKAFLDNFHQSKMNQLTLVLENETWNQADIPPEFQLLVQNFGQVDLISSVSTSASSDDIAAQAAQVESGQENGGKVARHVILEGQQFKIVGSVLMLLKLLTSYLEVAAHLPALGTDIVQKVIEVLKTYNSLVCQLVLGAGAMHLAGLKSITAKHLGLSSQCIGLMVLETPRIREALRGYLPVKHHVLLNDFDRVVQDYKDHQGEIFRKLVSIMKERVDTNCRSIGNMEWDNESVPVPSPYMKSLIKETTVLHRVLSGLLPAEQLDLVFSDVADVFQKRLIEIYSRLELPNPAGRNRLHNDITHLMSCLRKINEKGTSTKELEDFARRQFGISA